MSRSSRHWRIYKILTYYDQNLTEMALGDLWVLASLDHPRRLTNGTMASYSGFMGVQKVLSPWDDPLSLRSRNNIPGLPCRDDLPSETRTAKKLLV